MTQCSFCGAAPPSLGLLLWSLISTVPFQTSPPPEAFEADCVLYACTVPSTENATAYCNTNKQQGMSLW